MWTEFWGACALACALLFAPGFVVLRALRVSVAPSLALAPLLSIAAYGVMGMVLAWVGVPATTATVALPPLGASLVLLAVLARRRRDSDRRAGATAAKAAELFVPGAHELPIFCLYVVMGVAVTCVMLVSNLDGPASFIQAWDNVAHFNLVRSMSESHVWSTLTTTYYPGVAAGIDPFASSTGSYYPVAWHLVAVMLVDALGVPVTLAANATNVVIVALVYPPSAYALLRVAFPRRQRVVAYGALCCLAFASFPWNMIVRWTLYPNLMSFALLPAEAAALMAAIGPSRSARTRLIAASVSLCGGVTLFLTQPNAVFSVAILLVPYLAWRLWEHHAPAIGGRRALGYVALFLGLAALVWVTLYQAPFMQAVVQYFWQPMMGLHDAVGGVLDASFVGGKSQSALALLLLLGVVAGCARPCNRWLVVSFAFSAVLFVVAVSGDDVPLKHLLAGFWYTDPYRVAAMTAIYAVPLASLGLQVTADGAGRVVSALTDRLLAGRFRIAPQHVVPIVLAALFVVGVFGAAAAAAPCTAQAGADDETDELAAISQQMANKNYAGGRAGYNAEKSAFVDQVLALVGPDAVVLNEPYDGSVYAYGVNGLNVYYRYMSGYGTGGETRQSRSLRLALSKLCGLSRPDVASALAQDDVHYLMILDQYGDLGGQFPPYEPAQWIGIESVTDETPGFEVLLSQGRMRLYRIVGTQGTE